MYVITVDVDFARVRNERRIGSEEARAEISRILQRHGFIRWQGNICFGDERINAVNCVLAALDLTRCLPWFTEAVRDIRMARIEELTDLMPAIRQSKSDVR